VPDIPDYVPVSALSISEDEAPKAKPAAKAAKPKAGGKAPPKDVVAASKKPSAADRQAQKDEILAAARAKALAAAQ
jgi:hypothetical protein